MATLSFYPLYAGPAVRFQRYAPKLKHQGVNLSVFTQAVTKALLDRDGSLSSQKVDTFHRSPGNDYPLSESVGGIEVQRVVLPLGWRTRRAYFRALAEHCRRRRVDVVQFLSLDIWALPYLFELRRHGVRTVFTMTLMAHLSPLPWKRELQRQYRRLPFNSVDSLVVSSSVMRRYALDLGTTVPIHVIPNGVNLNRFRPVDVAALKIDLRRKLGLEPQRDVIVAVGPVTPRKGTAVLIDAFTLLANEFPNAVLVLVGPRHDLARDNLANFRHRLQVAIERSGTQRQIIFTGPVNNVEDYLRAADILIFPSRREGMPNVVPEAMACGLPVVINSFLGLPEEFGTPGRHYLLYRGSSNALADQMSVLLKSVPLRHSLGVAARDWVQKHMCFEQSLVHYAELYRSLSTRTKADRSREHYSH